MAVGLVESMLHMLEDVEDGMASGPYDSDADLAAFLGVDIDDLHYGALAVRDEDQGKKRDVNPWIQKNIPVKGDCPRQ